MCNEETNKTSFEMMTLNEVMETINEFGSHGCKVLVTPSSEEGLYYLDVEGEYVAEWTKEMGLE